MCEVPNSMNSIEDPEPQIGNKSKLNDRVIKPCPFCGEQPMVSPANPEEHGTAWGSVSCENKECPARPIVRDGVEVSDDRGSEAYKMIAIWRWNERAL